MQGLLIGIDRTSAWAGKTAGWAIVALTAVICYEVFARYMFRAPTSWAYDTSYMLYGLLFMVAGAYTLSRGGHVRADFLYRSLSPRGQAMIDLPLYILFFIPGIVALIWFGWNFFHMSFLQNEHSSVTPDGPLIWPFKFLIPLSGALMLLQGIAEMIRCVIALRTGAWPDKLSDVEELETKALALAAAQQAAAAAHAHGRQEPHR
ncbi:TRAP transporter small permease subunit [Elioraea sp.]|uniref:TRAP transporter small permease subunit n=1 Tax=Elioraea sp. TaxID=2185103 RepID=UPI0025C3000D|nr:TRAP transporter small permease subunit [Elioraea sp.]